MIRDQQEIRATGEDSGIVDSAKGGNVQGFGERQRGVEKLQDLRLMAGGVAHNINNSLLPIMGYLRLARTEVPAGTPLAEYLGHMDSAARRLARLSSDMLAYSGRGVNFLEILDISALVGTFAPLLAGIAKKPVELRYMLRQDLPPIEADHIQIRQAVTALVANAAEAIEGGEGTIVIRTGAGGDAFSTEKATAGEDLPRGEMVFLEVSDNGCGISPEIAEKIFNPFFSTKLVGRGIGLAAVQGIVLGHGGSITVESRPGVGSVFRMLFPAATRPGNCGPGC